MSRIAITVVLAGALLPALMFATLGSWPTWPLIGVPLDDTYIHIQYARQFGHGYGYCYYPNAAPSSGATSWLYLHLLAIAAFLGFDGDGLVVCGILLGIAGWSATAYYTYAILARWTNRRHASWGTAVVLSSGALIWSAVSGMEITLASALLPAAIDAYDRYQSQPDRISLKRFAIQSSLLALVRPEGGFVALLLWISALGQCYRQNQRLPDFRTSKPWLFPPLAFLLPYLTTWIATGTPGSTGMAAKSELTDPTHTGIGDIIGAIAENLAGIISFLNGENAWLNGWVEFTPPGLVPATVVAGIIALGLHDWSRCRVPIIERLIHPITAACCAVLVWLGLVATISVWSLHNYRYLLPVLPLVIVLSSSAVYYLECGVRRQAVQDKASLSLNPRVSSGIIITGLGLIVVLLQLSSWPRWGQRLMEETASIRYKQGLIASWLVQHTPPDTRLGINDAGLLAYESRHPIYDLVGLMEDTETARVYRMGDGTIFEWLTDPHFTKRPGYMVVFPEWFEQLEAFDVLGEPILQVPDPFYPDMHKVVYRSSWSSVGQGETPRLSAMPSLGWAVIDTLDVADERSERLHRYRSIPAEGRTVEEPMLFRRNFGYHEEIEDRYPFWTDAEILAQLRESRRLPYYDILDAGRRHTGIERFTVRNLNPEKPLAIALRTCDDREDRQAFHYALRVKVDGQILSDWHIQGTPWNWYERWYEIPAEALEHPTAAIELEALSTEDSYWFVSCRYWFLQPD